MCLVIDANQAGVFCKQQRPYVQSLLGWINSGGRVVSGGQLERELFKIREMRVLALEWSRRGNLIRLPTEDLQRETDRVRDKCRSNDPHVVAVAIVGRADVVVTEDNLLIQDLKDPSIVGSKRRIFKEDATNPNRLNTQIRLLRTMDCPK